MNTFAVDLSQIAVIITTDGKTERIPYRTKRQADKKVVELCAAGYKFNPLWWHEQKMRRVRLTWQAHNLCNALCHKLYDWTPDDPARLERILVKARARLARREAL